MFGMRKFLRDKAPPAEPETEAPAQVPEPTEVPSQATIIAAPTVGRILLYTPPEGGDPLPAIVVHIAPTDPPTYWCQGFPNEVGVVWLKGKRLATEPTPDALHWPPRV
jgi:hypothetical protein